jgi:pimeloyl-ACP methyl ester carboxylesterase
MSVEIDLAGHVSTESAGPLAQPTREAATQAAGVLTQEAAAAPSSEACPTPLGWAEVLESFRAESAPWTVDVAGSLLHGRTLGRGQPLYFLNGISGNCELFCLLTWLLRDQFRCVLFDYRDRNSPASRGANAKPAGLTVERLADDLLAVADAQHDSAFCIFAAPFGSLIALAALARNPERIERAILLGGFAHRHLSRVERTLCRLGQLLPGDLSRVPLRSTLQVASHQRAFPPFDYSRWGFFTANTNQTSIRDLGDRARLMDRTDLRGRLSHVERPVLLLHTEHEGAVSAAGEEELERELPRATSESLPLAGQLAYLTHPHRVAKAVRSFLGGATFEPRPGRESLGLDNSCGADHKDESHDRRSA